MEDVILSYHRWGKEVRSKEIEQKIQKMNITNFTVAFPNDIYKKIEILQKFTDAGFHVYIQMHDMYQNMLGKLEVPYWYDGRIIVRKELGSTVLKFVSDERFLLPESRNFIMNIFANASIYISEMDAQYMQNYYYACDKVMTHHYLDTFVCAIDLENDGSHMNFYYREGMKINEVDIQSFILAGEQTYEIIEEK